MDHGASDNRENYLQCRKCAYRVKEQDGQPLKYGYMKSYCDKYPTKESGEAKPSGIALNYAACKKRKGEDPGEQYDFTPTGARFIVRGIG